LKQPKLPLRLKASQAIGLLGRERGTTLVEVLVVAIVLAVMILTIYIGVVYAEKTARMNYRYRQASLIASGEVEKNYVYFLKMGFMPTYTSYDVVMDKTEQGQIAARVSITRGEDTEYNVTKRYPFSYVIAEVRWVDPDTEKTQLVRVREDFYEIEGS